MAELKFNPSKLEEGICYFPQATGEKVIVSAHAGNTHAYKNVCPHAGTPLNAQHEKIVAKEGQFLVCSAHGAIFETATGLCVGGPCSGASLTRVEFEETSD